jgi:DNA-binding MarR family transcriptional regulator
MRGQFEGEKVVLERALPFVIHACYQLIRSATYREFLSHGLELTPEQWIVLVRLWQVDGQSQAALGESTLRDASTMSRIINTMEKAGLVQRFLDGADGRALQIKLTSAGKALKPKLLPLAKKIVARLEGNIPERDLEITHRTLTRMLQNLR